MDIEKLMNEPDQFFSGVTARITEQAIEFENRCIGEALSMWQIRKEDVLKRIHEADKLQAENEKLRAELEQVKRALAMMWFSYVNSDKEMPHSYETEALEEAEHILGPWAECMPKYLRRGPKED